MTDSHDIEATVRGLVEPIAAELELFVYDVEVTSGQGTGAVRILVERLNADGEGTGVTIDELTQVSRELGYILDAEDPIPFAYRLEVSSPGVERKLRVEEHFEAALGDRVRVVLRQQTADRRSVLEGELKGNDEPGEFVVTGDDGKDRAFNVRHVKKAHTRYEFSKPRPGKGKKK